MKERLIVDKIHKFLKTVGAYPMKIADKFTSGIPDIIAILANGQTIYIEVKNETGVVSMIQQYVIDQATKRGAHAIVIRSVDELKDYMYQKKLLDKTIK